MVDRCRADDATGAHLSSNVANTTTAHAPSAREEREMSKLTKEQNIAAVNEWARWCATKPLGEIMELIAPHMQYATTEPGAPLSDKECNELNVSIYGGVSAEAQNAKWEKAIIAEYDNDEQYLDPFLSRIRARIEAKAKTPEERVRVAPHKCKFPINQSDDTAFLVYVDNIPRGPFFSKQEDAETYRLGLIAQLKQEASK